MGIRPTKQVFLNMSPLTGYARRGVLESRLFVFISQEANVFGPGQVST